MKINGVGHIFDQYMQPSPWIVHASSDTRRKLSVSTVVNGLYYPDSTVSMTIFAIGPVQFNTTLIHINKSPPLTAIHTKGKWHLPKLFSFELVDW